MKKLNNLQILRAFAALNVVLFHVIGTSASYGFDVHYLQILSGWGSNGVDMFFVLSGFIMVYIQTQKISNPISFFVDRFSRIAPLYYFLTVFIFLLINFFPHLFRTAHIETKHLVASIFFMSGAILHTYPVLFDGWTLEYEILFYVVIAVALTFQNKSLSFILVTLIISFSIIFLSLDTVAFEFLLGVFLGNLYLNTERNIKLSMLSVLVGSLLFTMSIFIKPESASILNSRVILYGLPSFLIIYGLIGIKQAEKGISVMLGDASYSMYLLQVFTIPIFYKIATASNLAVKISHDILAIFCLTFTAVVGLSFYWIVERRLTKSIRHIINIVARYRRIKFASGRWSVRPD